MSILISWLSPLRVICMAIDSIVFNLLDNAYMLVIKLSTAELFQHETIRSITNNLYILFGVVAFFRLALVLVNAIIDPEKLNEKGKGLSNIFFRVVGMIILLAVTPFLFQMSYDLQKRIVGADPKQNLIFKTLLGDNANIAGEDAGKALRNITLSSLITIDKNYLKADGKICQSENDDDCGFMPLTCVPNGDGTCTNQGGYIFGENCDWDNCQKAVSRYNEMYVNEDMKISTLFKSVGVSKKIEVDGDKEEVYVYNYMFIITGFVGGFMIYIIISFAIDIAVRMFELFVLEVLSPLFIATFVDPKSAQSGPFKNWLSAVGKSYANLYIKLAILALMILLVALINQSKIFTAMSDLGGWVKIFAVIGLLIFAKKAPKWIGDMIGIKTNGVGLWSPKKLAEGMVGGALAAKAGRTALGMGMGAVKDMHAARKANRINRAASGQTIRSRAHNAAKAQKGLKNKAGAYLGSIFKPQDAKENWNNMWKGKRDNIAGGFGAMIGGVSKGAEVGWNSENLKDLNAKTKANAKVILDTQAPAHKSAIGKLGSAMNDKSDKIMNKYLGDTSEQAKRAKTLKDDNTAKTNGMLVRNSEGKRNEELSPVDSKEVKKLCKNHDFNETNLEGISQALIQARIDEGMLKGISLNAQGQVLSNGQTIMKKDDKGVEKPIKPSDFCKENDRIFNNNGALAMESIARELAVEKATEYMNNNKKISDANQAAANANNQLLQVKGNIEATLGKEGVEAFTSLENEISKQQAALKKYNETLQNNNDPNEIRAARKAYEASTAAVTEAQNSIDNLTDVSGNKVLSTGTGAAYTAAVQIREDAVNESKVITEANMEISKDIYTDIKTYGEDSYFNPNMKEDKHAHVNFMETGKADTAIELMRLWKNKTDDKYAKATEKKD